MTKLEEKLKELGYENGRTLRIFYKEYDGNKNIFINIDEYHKKITDYYIHFYSFVQCQQDINALQQAYNTMEKDLEELKQCQD